MVLEDNWVPDSKVMKKIEENLKEDGFDMNKNGIILGNKNYSANEILEEIKNSSEVGKSLYSLMEEYIK